MNVNRQSEVLSSPESVPQPIPAFAQAQVAVSPPQGKQIMQNDISSDEMRSVLECQNVSVAYSGEAAVQDVSLAIFENKITAIIGPSGCGKSTLLRSFNRMNDFVNDVTIEGKINFFEQDIYAKEVDPVEVRLRIGMVFQRPNPFPKSIYRNIAWGPSINGFEGNMDERVETALKQAALWNEVKDRLDDSALNLSGGQQQRLCIARTLAMEPELILMDEPCSALDPVSTSSIEDLLFELKENYTIVIVTHNMQQASRVSDYTAFLENGVLIEFDKTRQLFTRPSNKRTEEYVTGRFG
jgi:phosphate transport system ATP-binding protein